MDDDDDEVMLRVSSDELTALPVGRQAETNTEAWFNNALRPRKPEGSSS